VIFVFTVFKIKITTNTYTMRILRLLIVFCGLVSPCAAQDFLAIDAHARSVKFPPKRDVPTLTKQLVEGCRTQREQARSFYVWITHHIKYDWGTSQNEFLTPDQWNQYQSPAHILRVREAVCQGYANLFKALCDQAGLSCMVVGGSIREGDQAILTTGHAWNVVKTDGQWGLVDATWGAGEMDYDSKNFVRKFSDAYFLPDPLVMAERHFPDDPLFQLLPKPITWAEFQKKETEYTQILHQRADVAPDERYTHLTDSLDQYVQSDSTQRLLATGLRARSNSPDYNAGRLSVAEYYLELASLQIELINTDIDATPVGNIDLAWYQTQSERFGVAEQHLKKCLAELAEPPHADYLSHYLAHFKSSTRQVLKACRDGQKATQDSIKKYKE
jgi:hypothetical protein